MKKKETDLDKYIKQTNSACYITETIKTKARQLISGHTTTLEKVKAIFNFLEII